MNYKVGDTLIAVKSFELEDVYHRLSFYGIGDKFIIMNIKHLPLNWEKNGKFADQEIEFNLNSNKSIYRWIVEKKHIKEFEEYLVLESNFTKVIRKKKIIKLSNV